MVDKAHGYGHTVLTRPMGVRLMKREGYRYDIRSLDVLYEKGQLISLTHGENTVVTTPKRALGEALCARWLARKPAPPSWGLPAHGSGYSPCQERAWGILAHAGSGLLTGLPGTGKTWLIARLVECLVKQKVRVECAAPTGKAASVLSLKMGRFPVQTIHRLLGLRPGQLPQRDADSPIKADVVIVDEASMIDSQLMGYLMTAIGSETNLILCGDPNQIPPVSAGSPFHDMVKYNMMPHAHLETIQRQSAGNGIIAMSAAMAKGDLIIPDDNVTRVDMDIRDVEASVIDSYCESADKALILSPVKKEKYDGSTHRINEAISNRLLRSRISNSKFAHGDRIMFTINDYVHGFVNGEQGVLVDYHKGNATILSDFGVEYQLEGWSLSKYAEWAYALTIHKSQGSEADNVVLILNSRVRFMYTRNLLYTAITRAKKNLIIMGDFSLL